MTIWEAGIVVGVMLLLLSGYLGMQSDVVDADEARLRAGMIERLHGGVEGYLRSEYAFLERCLDVPSLEEEWNDDSSAGGQAGPFKAVRLYSLPADIENMPSGNHVQALTADLDHLRCDSHHPDATAYPGAPRSLSEAGFLPAGLSRLRYEAGADASSNLWRGLDFRLMIRAVNLSRQTPDLSAIPPIAVRVGLQALLVVQARRDEGMFEGEAGAILRAMTTAEVGLLRSTGRGTGVGGAIAERTIAGTGGGWRMELCDDSGNGVAVSCDDPVHGPVFDNLLGSQVIRIENDASGSTVQRAFISGAAGGQMVSGGSPAGGSPAARVVTVTTIGRDDALRNVLYRADIGIPEANRMETDIDMGGYGLLNVAYVTGIDIDGDGLVDRGIGLVGPPNDDPADDDRRRNPVTVYGDLHVRGALHVGTGEDEEVFETDIPAGSVWASRGIQVGADAFDEALPDASLLAQQGMQVGGIEFAMSFDDSGTAAPEGSVWVRGATQVGDVREVIALDSDGLDLDFIPEFSPAYDTDVPAGGLLTAGQIRSSGGMRAVGPEIMLAASTSVLPSDLPDMPSRAAPNRSWEAVATGLGNILDDELRRPNDTTTDTYAGDGGRLQFRTEGDDLHMVAGSGILKVTPKWIANIDLEGIVDEHGRPISTEEDGPRSAAHYEGDVGLETEGNARIIVDSTDVWVQDVHRNVQDAERMKSRTLHDALPRYVSKLFEWQKQYKVGVVEIDGEERPGLVVDSKENEVDCAETFVPRSNPSAIDPSAIGGERRSVLIPNGWARKDFAGRAQASLVIAAIPPYYNFPITFTEDYVQAIYVNHYLPYTGWAIDPKTGKDAAGAPPKELDSVQGITGPDKNKKWKTYIPNLYERELATDYRRTIYCDYLR